MIASLLLALLPAQSPLHLTASVDRDRVPVGDEVIYTLRATSELTGAFRIELPQVSALEAIDHTERTGLVVGSSPAMREFVAEVRIRAMQVGTWKFSPVLVFVGSMSALAPDVPVTVVGAGPADPSASNPTLLAMIQRAPPPTSGSTATLGIVVSDGRVVQGQQLDVLTTAWFPRSLRARLRRPPTLKPPVLAGVWSVPQPAVPGIVASRAIGEEVYDLFVSHQVVFPLTPGQLTIPAARLEYGVPAGRRASGEERIVEAASAPVNVTVTPLPEAGRPAGFAGPVARKLRVGYRLRTLPARAGEPLPVEVTIAGEGNLAFWSPPEVAWPPGSRAYLDHVADVARPAGGRLGGVKTFAFLLLADSVGSISLPPLTYRYLDPSDGYREATGSGMVVAVLPPTASGPTRPPPPLAAGKGGWPLVIGRLDHLPIPWWSLVLLPMVVGVLIRAARRLIRPRPRAVAAPEGPAILDQMIVALVPEPERGRADGIVHGFRQAGIDRETAVLLARLKTELDQARFAPGAEAGGPALGSRVERALRRLPAAVRRMLGLAGILLAVGSAGRKAAAQTDPPERPYLAGQPRLAAQGFAERARAEPGEWRHWYDLAAARYVAGQDAGAAAALERAFDLAPRARPARALWTELEREHAPLHDVGRGGGLAVAEWRAIAIALGLLAGLAIAIGRGSGALRIGLVGAALVVTGWAADRARDRNEPAGFTQAAVTLRLSPHGLAPERGNLAALSRVVIAARAGRWVLARAAHGNEGWIPASAVVPVRPLD